MFKVATPFLHVAFSVTQIHGSMILFRMYRRQNRILAEQLDSDVERCGLPVSGQSEMIGDGRGSKMVSTDGSDLV